MKNIFNLSIVALVFLAGCATTTTVDQVAAVRNRAAYDFNCDPNKIQVTWLQAGTYGADGCRNKQVYTVRGTMVYKEGAAPNPVYVEPRYGYGMGYRSWRYIH